MAHFRLGAPAYSRSLFTAEKVGRVVERAHQTLEQTRGPLTVRLNTGKHDGVLTLRRHDASPTVTAYWEHNLNAPATTVIPEWVGEALHTLEGLRPVHLVGFDAVGRET